MRYVLCVMTIEKSPHQKKWQQLFDINLHQYPSNQMHLTPIHHSNRQIQEAALLMHEHSWSKNKKTRTWYMWVTFMNMKIGCLRDVNSKCTDTPLHNTGDEHTPHSHSSFCSCSMTYREHLSCEYYSTTRTRYLTFPVPGGPHKIKLGIFPSSAIALRRTVVSSLPTTSSRVRGRYFSTLWFIVGIVYRRRGWVEIMVYEELNGTQQLVHIKWHQANKCPDNIHAETNSPWDVIPSLFSLACGFAFGSCGCHGECRWCASGRSVTVIRVWDLSLSLRSEVCHFCQQWRCKLIGINTYLSGIYGEKCHLMRWPIQVQAST